MGAQEAFNRRVGKLISDKLNEPEKKLIKLVKARCNFKGENYYYMFDCWCLDKGLIFGTISVLNEDDECIGHKPHIRYLPSNALNEEPHVYQFYESSAFFSLEQCYRYLADEIVLRILPRVKE